MIDAVAMTELFAMFHHFCLSGKDVPLHMECQAGQAWLQLRVHLPHCRQHPQMQQKHGTSHLRCHARRVEARAPAEIEAAENYLKVVEDAAIALAREIAVQADLFPPPLETQDGLAEKINNTLEHPIELEQADDENSTTKTLTRAAQLNVHAKSWPLCDIQDKLCHDPQYLQQHHKPQEPTN